MMTLETTSSSLLENETRIEVNSEYVVLVNEQDEVIGSEEKLKAHQEALLHRAFSVFVYRKTEDSFEFLLQQRSDNKYHCGGLWTNTCCSHPRLGEEVLEAAQRRLKEEMSLAVSLNKVGSFLYKAPFANGLTEHEFDHVLVGEYDGIQAIVLDPEEAQAFRWIALDQLQAELVLHPKRYTPWFSLAFELVMENLCCKF